MNSVGNINEFYQEESFGVEIKNTNELEKNRIIAILNCYGVEAYKDNKIITIDDTNEKIVPWHLEGITSQADLKSMFSLETIVELYEVNKDFL